tara:strand:+ start:825 stop:1022 length:198 start_codon:yes stop_codon:yes gene_type:complete
MKVQPKDDIIKCLIDMLQYNHEKNEECLKECYMHEGWIEALKWVLGLTKEEKNVFKEHKDIESKS